MKTLTVSLCKGTICLLLFLTLSACFVRPYRFDIKQGNELNPAKVEEIQPGMSEEQVRYILGTPMLHDVFHTNRWDYIYYEKPGYSEPIRRHLAIYFENGKVDRVTHDPMPAAVA